MSKILHSMSYDEKTFCSLTYDWCFLTCYTVFYNLAQGQARCNIYFNVTVQIGKEMTLEKGENLTIPNVKYCKD